MNFFERPSYEVQLNVTACIMYLARKMYTPYFLLNLSTFPFCLYRSSTIFAACCIAVSVSKPAEGAIRCLPLIGASQVGTRTVQALTPRLSGTFVKWATRREAWSSFASSKKILCWCASLSLRLLKPPSAFSALLTRHWEEDNSVSWRLMESTLSSS